MKLDYIHGATTFGGGRWWETPPSPVPERLRNLLVRHGIEAVPGNHIPMNQIDKALNGRSISERMWLKSALRSADLIP